MARKSRIDLPFCVYYISCRGNNGNFVFLQDTDKSFFVNLLENLSSRFQFRIHAFCLLNNEIHFLIESSEKSISEFMRCLLTSYSIYFNRRNKTSGHLFYDRFKSLIVQKGFHLPSTARYIHLLPFYCFLTRNPQKYQWSSLSSYLYSTVKYSFLYTHDILNWFKSSPKSHEQFISDGLKRKREIDVVDGCFIGNFSFIKKIKAIIHDNENNKDQRKERIFRDGYSYAEQILKKYSLKYSFNPDDLKNGHRRMAHIHDIHMKIIMLLRENTEWTFQQIADYFNISRVYVQTLYKKASSVTGRDESGFPES